MPLLPTFCMPSGQAPSAAAACDRTINLLLEPLSNDQKAYVLYGAPGLRPVALLPSAPVRGLYTTTGGRVFAATSTTLYEIFAGWSFLSRGTIPTGTAPISWTDNGLHMVFSVEGHGRIYDLTANTLAALPTTGPATWGHFGYLDGYILVNEPGTRRFWYSALLDATSWPALHVYSAEARPDPITRLIVDHRQVVLFGTQTIEIWNSTGQAPPPTSVQGPFARMESVAIEQGSEAEWSPAALDLTFLWLAGSPRGQGPVYQLEGYSPQRISTYALEEAMRLMPTVADARAFTLRQGGHAFYGLDFPSGGQTWLLDRILGAWTELVGLQEDGSFTNYPCNVTTAAFGQHLWGDRASGQLSLWDTRYHLYGTRPRLCRRSTPHLRKAQDRVRYHKFGLMQASGKGLDAGVVPGTDPQVMLRTSRDGGETWSSGRWRSAGKMGRYAQQVDWYQLGQARTMAFEVTTTDPVPIAWLGATVEVS